MHYNGPDDDRSLLASVSAGDQLAFRSLFDAYRNKVFTYAVRYLKSREQAEEIVQNVFLKLWLKREGLTEIVNFGGYLRTITNNATLDALKKRASEYRHQNESLQEWSDLDNTTEDAIFSKDAKSYISLALEKLPKQQRLVYQMCQIDGLKQKEVAEKLNISPLTVKVHLREATKGLKALLKNGESIPLIAFLFLGMLR
ncbi:RNA polymerase sigma-70 factor, ECF subfamily [Pedobacter sp. ok626]|uniref:RNA polymerase sigma factor n=1 Tax=Pedobacter sp. ok626 TaxID=1761882 RepID=UPI000880580C|nr:RNA polymerase sigma-70 factor [Pedobacter sp. ok626]SDL54941.1 RNA polymerase sigma-70 factor, ECF subfamily [Pedobacter sp. ok626]